MVLDGPRLIASASQIRYALALASDPASRDMAEAWAVVHEHCRKVAELHVACKPLLLLVLGHLEYGGIAQPPPSIRHSARTRPTHSHASRSSRTRVR